MSLHKKIVHELLTEFFEVAIHNLIKIKRIYPDVIFVRRQKYGTIVYEIIHPQLKEYITNFIQLVHHLIKEECLTKVIINFLDKNNQNIIEKIVFEITRVMYCIERDTFLLNIEKIFRSFFIKLFALKTNVWEPEEIDDINFVLQICTKESSSISFLENPKNQHFPWINTTIKCPNVPAVEIIPICSLKSDFIGMQIYLEK